MPIPGQRGITGTEQPYFVPLSAKDAPKADYGRVTRAHDIATPIISNDAFEYLLQLADYAKLDLNTRAWRFGTPDFLVSCNHIPRTLNGMPRISAVSALYTAAGDPFLHLIHRLLRRSGVP